MTLQATSCNYKTLKRYIITLCSSLLSADTTSRNDALVRIRVMLVDKKSPNFETKFKKVCFK